MTTTYKIRDNASIFTELVLPEFQACDFYITCNGRIVERADVTDGQVYHVVPRLVGGKGGFGSMLRAIGAQIEKTTNREACRDLSGRRMRDVNYEKEMKDWIGKKAEREQEKLEEREMRKARRRATPHHKFDDPTYTEQTAVVSDNLSAALSAGMAAGESKKRRAAETITTSSKKACEWMGVDEAEMSSSDDDSIRDMSSNSRDISPLRDPPATVTTPSDPSPGVSAMCHGKTEPSQEGQGSPHGAGDQAPDNGSSRNHAEICNSGENSGERRDDIDPRQTESDDLPRGSRSVGSTPQPHSCHQQNASGETNTDAVVLEQFTTPSQLEVLGLDRLKAELMTRGLKCGGSLTERAARLFRVRGLMVGEVDPGLLAKGKGGGRRGGNK